MARPALLFSDAPSTLPQIRHRPFSTGFRTSMAGDTRPVPSGPGGHRAGTWNRSAKDPDRGTRGAYRLWVGLRRDRWKLRVLLCRQGWDSRYRQHRAARPEQAFCLAPLAVLASRTRAPGWPQTRGSIQLEWSPDSLCYSLRHVRYRYSPVCGMQGLACGPPLLVPKNQGRLGAPYCLSRPKLSIPGPLKLPNSNVQLPGTKALPANAWNG